MFQTKVLHHVTQFPMELNETIHYVLNITWFKWFVHWRTHLYEYYTGIAYNMIIIVFV